MSELSDTPERQIEKLREQINMLLEDKKRLEKWFYRACTQRDELQGELERMFHALGRKDRLKVIGMSRQSS